MASTFQQQSLRRKVIYSVLILAILTGMLALRYVNTRYIHGIDAQARDLEIHEESLGEVELTGSALRLGLTGMRGVAVCGLWWAATDKQMKQQWNELEILVRSLTKLQPHFITPWLFQSWNLAYNVSVESDRIKDKYFYMTQGIELLAEGERQNRRNPDLRFNVGFYNQHKIGLSDESNTLRCLYQMSCMDPVERDPARMRTQDASGASVVDMEKFGEFCRRYPLLVRRLRETLKKNSPADVLDFLAENQKIPSIYDDKRDPALRPDERLKPPDQQFPLLPPKDPQRGIEAVVTQVDFDNFMAARDWYLYAVEPMPPPSRSLEPTPVAYDPRQYRMPRYMASPIFRGYPARGQTYVAEYLERDGWFDETGWQLTDGWFNGDKFSDGKEAVVGQGTAWARNAWQRAHSMWREDGKANGLYLEPDEMKDFNDRARKFREAFGVKPGDRTVSLPVGDYDKEMRDSYKAHVQLSWYDYMRELTNFPYFFARSLVESDSEAVKARKIFFEAEQLRKAGDRPLAMARYVEAFPKWRDLMLAHPDYSRNETQQEDLYEFVLRYLDLVQETYGKRLKTMVIVQDFLMQGANRPPIPVGWLPPVYFVPQIKPNIVTPLDGVDKDNQPFVNAAAKDTVRSRLHLPVLAAPPPETGLTPAPPISPVMPSAPATTPETKGKQGGSSK
jgi:hypothetical protein